LRIAARAGDGGPWLRGGAELEPEKQRNLVRVLRQHLVENSTNPGLRGDPLLRAGEHILVLPEWKVDLRLRAKLIGFGWRNQTGVRPDLPRLIVVFPALHRARELGIIPDEWWALFIRHEQAEIDWPDATHSQVEAIAPVPSERVLTTALAVAELDGLAAIRYGKNLALSSGAYRARNLSPRDAAEAAGLMNVAAAAVRLGQTPLSPDKTLDDREQLEIQHALAVVAGGQDALARRSVAISIVETRKLVDDAHAGVLAAQAAELAARTAVPFDLDGYRAAVTALTAANDAFGPVLTELAEASADTLPGARAIELPAEGSVWWSGLLAIARAHRRVARFPFEPVVADLIAVRSQLRRQGWSADLSDESAPPAGSTEIGSLLDMVQASIDEAVPLRRLLDDDDYVLHSEARDHVLARGLRDVLVALAQLMHEVNVRDGRRDREDSPPTPHAAVDALVGLLPQHAGGPPRLDALRREVRARAASRLHDPERRERRGAAGGPTSPRPGWARRPLQRSPRRRPAG
jgi:hypothetical protein